MSRSTYFVQECPTCGRNLQVRVQYLGKQVVCQHCSARFEAYEGVKPDTILKQFPPAGTPIASHDVVSLTVSRSSEAAPVTR